MSISYTFKAGSHGSFIMHVVDGTTRGEALGELAKTTFVAVREELGVRGAAQVAVKLADLCVLAAGTDGLPPIPKPEAAAKPSRLKLWAVRRSRVFWFAVGAWGPLLISQVILRLMRLAGVLP